MSSPCSHALAKRNGSTAILPPTASWDGLLCWRAYLQATGFAVRHQPHWCQILANKGNMTPILLNLFWKEITDIQHHGSAKRSSLWRQRADQQLLQNDAGWPASAGSKEKPWRSDNVDARLFKAILSERTNDGNSKAIQGLWHFHKQHCLLDKYFLPFLVHIVTAIWGYFLLLYYDYSLQINFWTRGLVD